VNGPGHLLDRRLRGHYRGPVPRATSYSPNLVTAQFPLVEMADIPNTPYRIWPYHSSLKWATSLKKTKHRSNLHRSFYPYQWPWAGRISPPAGPIQTYPRTPAEHAPGPPIATPGGIRSTTQVARKMGSSDNDVIQCQERQDITAGAHACLTAGKLILKSMHNRHDQFDTV
jgi:hypothetical protein